MGDVIVFSCRCLDLPSDHLSRIKFSRILAIIPGPKAPKILDAYTVGIMKEFAEYGTQYALSLPDAGVQ